MLFIILYECKNWSFTLRETHKLRVFEKRILWVLKTDAVTRGSTKLHDELRNLYFSTNIIGMTKSNRKKL
jgi:hypothetical protein